MKHLLIALMMISAPALAQESCQVKSQDVNTPVPKELKGATIIVRTKDGKERKMKAEEFKVVPRKQQFKVTEKQAPCSPAVIEREVTVEKIVEVPAKEKKNMVIGGLSYDYTNLSNEISTSGNTNTVKLYSNKGPVGDIGYMRRRLFDSNFAAGLSVNINVAPRCFIGYEF